MYGAIDADSEILPDSGSIISDKLSYIQPSVISADSKMMKKREEKEAIKVAESVASDCHHKKAAEPKP